VTVKGASSADDDRGQTGQSQRTPSGDIEKEQDCKIEKRKKKKKKKKKKKTLFPREKERDHNRNGGRECGQSGGTG
jgi:hypothetical protein